MKAEGVESAAGGKGPRGKALDGGVGRAGREAKQGERRAGERETVEGGIAERERERLQKKNGRNRIGVLTTKRSRGGGSDQLEEMEAAKRRMRRRRGGDGGDEGILEKRSGGKWIEKDTGLRFNELAGRFWVRGFGFN
ncbi:uncharacterized protein A4U43_C01F2970 [Asparagus officinalis]|uniref:Uncharacterized protein n=1 Tax=Asparagus officinalis TaxID=4686 RepID=A0A5P1FMZ1_ASPOF|nr:uncharacterized protein A4U43_C01F2970 [Asparagus officinalis]